jgi:cytochrome d ubiquinol oxidase subunit I
MVLSVSAYYLLKKRHVEFAKASMRVALVVALAAALLQLLSGHESGKMVAAQQPAKMAAFEGHVFTGPADLYLFGWYFPPPPIERNMNSFPGGAIGVAIPGMLSWILHGSTKASVPGLQEFGKDIPPVNVVFQSYHAMVAIGMALIALSLAGAFFWWRQSLWEKRWFLWLCVWAVLLPQGANQLGWLSAEVGRQPWIVYNLMRTADAVSPGVGPGQIEASVVMFGIMYALLLVLFIYLLDHKIKQGPDETPEHGGPAEGLPLLQGDRAGR